VRAAAMQGQRELAAQDEERAEASARPSSSGAGGAAHGAPAPACPWAPSYLQAKNMSELKAELARIGQTPVTSGSGRQGMVQKKDLVNQLTPFCKSKRGTPAARATAAEQAPVVAAAAPQDRGDMSFELRTEISAGLAKLSANNISKVIDIIRQTMPGLGHDENEIEIDVNALDNATLWRLYDLIKQCQATRKAPGGNRASLGQAAGKQARGQCAVVERDIVLLLHQRERAGARMPIKEMIKQFKAFVNTPEKQAAFLTMTSLIAFQVDEPMTDPKTKAPVLDPKTNAPKVIKVAKLREEMIAKYNLEE